jgi:hypothetical protein
MRGLPGRLAAAAWCGTVDGQWTVEMARERMQRRLRTWPRTSNQLSKSRRFSHLYLFLPHSSILYIIIYLLWSSLITLSKYIHVRFSFEGFIETNLMVQSKFNLGF